MIEIDEGFVEGVEKIVGDRYGWFFDAAMGQDREITEAERGYASYLFGRMASPADLGKLEMLAAADSRSVRGNVIAAMSGRGERRVTDLLLRLLADEARPVVERLQVMRSLEADLDDYCLDRLRQLELERQPEELHYRIKLILEDHRRTGGKPGASG